MPYVEGMGIVPALAGESDMKTTTYKGYSIADCPVNLEVRVAHPRWPSDTLYTCDTVADAKAWVNAYRAGATWAVMAAGGAD